MDQPVNMVFHITASLGLLNFFLLARKWPDIIQQWKDVEAKFPKYRNKKEKRKLALEIRSYAVALVVCAVTEHILDLMTSLEYVRVCKPNEDRMTAFLQRNLVWIFEVTSFSLWKAILAKFINIFATCASNYLSFFIVMVSIGISSLFKRLNQEMNSVNGEVAR